MVRPVAVPFKIDPEVRTASLGLKQPNADHGKSLHEPEAGYSWTRRGGGASLAPFLLPNLAGWPIPPCRSASA